MLTDETLLAGLSSALSTTQFRAGQVIDGREGSAFLVTSGRVRVEFDGYHGAKVVLRTREALEFVSSARLLGVEASPFVALAETDVAGFWLSADLLLGEGLPAKLCSELSRRAAKQSILDLASSEPAYRDHLLLAQPDPVAQAIIERARRAQAELVTWDEQRTNDLLTRVATAVWKDAQQLAERERLETGMGDALHKEHKLGVVCKRVLADLLEARAHGRLPSSRPDGIEEYASPVGVIFGIVPATNPIPNSLFKILLALKTRNAVVFSYPSKAAAFGAEFIETIRGLLSRANAPVDLVQALPSGAGRAWVQKFMREPGIDLILATGGRALVRAAQSCGKPVYGVGPGNVPALVCADANLIRAARQIVDSKSYDNGIICGSENNLVVDQRVRDQLLTALTDQGAVVLTAHEKARALAAWYEPGGARLKRELLGSSARDLAELAGIRRTSAFRVLIVPAQRSEEPMLGREKLAPIIALFVEAHEDAIACCVRLLALDGAGHTAAIHTEDPANVQRFAEAMPAGRILVNTPSTFGMMGVSTGLPVSFMIGGGSFGGNISTDAVTWRHLVNIKRVARHERDVNLSDWRAGA